MDEGTVATLVTILVVSAIVLNAVIPTIGEATRDAAVTSSSVSNETFAGTTWTAYQFANDHIHDLTFIGNQTANSSVNTTQVLHNGTQVHHLNPRIVGAVNATILFNYLQPPADPDNYTVLVNGNALSGFLNSSTNTSTVTIPSTWLLETTTITYTTDGITSNITNSTINYFYYRNYPAAQYTFDGTAGTIIPNVTTNFSADYAYTVDSSVLSSSILLLLPVVVALVFLLWVVKESGIEV